MKTKVKYILISFFLMIIFNLGFYCYLPSGNFAWGLTPHYGIFFLSGLFFGPFGAIGSTTGNLICDLIRGYNPQMSIISAIITYATSYLAFKLWYGIFEKRDELTPPKLNNTYNILLFLGIIIICGFLYSLLTANLSYLYYPELIPIYPILIDRLFLNFVNFSFILGILGMWILNRIGLFYTPAISKKPVNKIFKILATIIITLVILSLLINVYITSNAYIITAELILITLLTFIYFRKPINTEILLKPKSTIPEKIMNIFLITTLIILIISILISTDVGFTETFEKIFDLKKIEVILSMMLLTDVLMLLYFIPALAIIKYIEIKLIEPILSFSQIENFIHKNKKIESAGLVNIYSDYINEKTEIGTLARSYTNLIQFNNNYIENIEKIEGEKKRIEAELDIATKIQAANLPTSAIETDKYIVNGYSKPAKEVGGDFFDYYQLDDENLAIVIGDASGKGIPAAILAMITQVIIRQLLKEELDPSKILYSLNNLLCEKNPESMFLTLWLGIYNTTTKKLIFSNAGHNPPIIKENDKIKYLEIDTGIVLGIMKDYEYINEEITIIDEIITYTDGITDANNPNDKMFGEENLLKFIKNHKNEDELIKSLLNEIKSFTQDTQQFDDMTLLYLKIK